MAGNSFALLATIAEVRLGEVTACWQCRPPDASRNRPDANQLDAVGHPKGPGRRLFAGVFR